VSFAKEYPEKRLYEEGKQFIRYVYKNKWNFLRTVRQQDLSVIRHLPGT